MNELIKRNAWISALLALGLAGGMNFLRRLCETPPPPPSWGGLWPLLLAGAALAGLFVWMEHFVLQTKRDYWLFPLYAFITAASTPLQALLKPYLAWVALGLALAFLLWHLQGEGRRRAELFTACFFYALALMLFPPAWVLSPVMVYGLLRSHHKGAGRLWALLAGTVYPLGAWAFLRWMGHKPLDTAFVAWRETLLTYHAPGLTAHLSGLVFWAALVFFYLQTTFRILSRTTEAATQETVRFYECLLVLFLSALAGTLLYPGFAPCFIPLICLPVTIGVFWKYVRRPRRRQLVWLQVTLVLGLMHFIAQLGLI